MHRSHSHGDLRHTILHYYNAFLRFSKRYFWFFVAWKIISFFLFARVILPLFAGSAASVAYVTVIATPDYAEPACVAAYSLLATGTKYPVIALVPTGYFVTLSPQLKRVFNEVLAVEPIANPNTEMARPEYKFRHELAYDFQAQTYTKLRIWGLTQYTRVLFFDSDVVFIRSVDDVFDKPLTSLMAVEECCGLFNSGVMLITPSQSTLDTMIEKIPSLPSFDGGDAGFLNSFFSDRWLALPFEYNAQQTFYLAPQYQRQWKYQEKLLRVLHFMGEKPWKSKDTLLAALHKPWHDLRAEMIRKGLLVAS